MSSYLSIQRDARESADNGELDNKFANEFVSSALYFSQLAYFDRLTIIRRMGELSPLNFSYYDRGGVSVFFAEFETFAVVSFRGREVDRWRELRQDLKFWKTNFDGKKIHAGFLESLNHVSKRLLLDIEDMGRGKRLLYTGHSMGGALSTLLSLEHAPTDICTFGSPKVAAPGDLTAVFDDVNFVRVFLSNDFVPTLPPDLFGYEHYGTPLSIDSGEKSKWESHLLISYLRGVLRYEREGETEDETEHKAEQSESL